MESKEKEHIDFKGKWQLIGRGMLFLAGIILVGLLFSWGLNGCGSSSTDPAPTEEFVFPTINPTSTPLPTPTFTATPYPTPTLTATPTAEPPEDVDTGFGFSLEEGGD
jgi:hypothetical protein